MKTQLLLIALGLMSAVPARADEPVNKFLRSATEVSEVTRSTDVIQKFPVGVTLQAVASMGWSRYRVYASNGCYVDARVTSEFQPEQIVHLTQIGPLTCGD